VVLEVSPGAALPVSLLLGRALPRGRFGYVAHGPAVAAGGLPTAMPALERAVRARLGDLAFLRVEPVTSAPVEDAAPPPAAAPRREAGPAWLPPGWRRAKPMQPDTTAIVDLRPEPEALLEGFKPKTRYNVRLAERRGVEVAREDDVASFDALAAATARRQGIRPSPPGYHADLLRVLGPERAWLYLARHGQRGEPLAGIIVGRFAGRATYLFGASADSGRELMPAYLLHWRAMLDLRQAGDREYDLWGVPPDDDPHHPWAGLRQFKAGWNGAPVVRAGAFDLPLRPGAWAAHRGLSTIRGTLRELKRSWGRGG
jgi:hypothetical protein